MRAKCAIRLGESRSNQGLSTSLLLALSLWCAICCAQVEDSGLAQAIINKIKERYDEDSNGRISRAGASRLHTTVSRVHAQPSSQEIVISAWAKQSFFA